MVHLGHGLQLRMDNCQGQFKKEKEQMFPNDSIFLSKSNFSVLYLELQCPIFCEMHNPKPKILKCLQHKSCSNLKHSQFLKFILQQLLYAVQTTVVNLTK